MLTISIRGNLFYLIRVKVSNLPVSLYPFQRFCFLDFFNSARLFDNKKKKITVLNVLIMINPYLSIFRISFTILKLLKKSFEFFNSAHISIRLFFVDKNWLFHV